MIVHRSGPSIFACNGNEKDLLSPRPAPESKDHFTLKSDYDLFIGGKWTAPKSGTYCDTIYSADEKMIPRIAEAERTIC